MCIQIYVHIDNEYEENRGKHLLVKIVEASYVSVN